MSVAVSERALEEAIVCALLEYGPDACPGDAQLREAAPPYGEAASGGYRRRAQEDYDRALCLIPRDVVDFILATQPQEWAKLERQHGAEVKARFLERLSQQIGQRGALDVLRRGVQDLGCKFALAYFRPASGLNEELRLLHAGNIFSVLPQLHYSEQSEKSLDLGLFLNGLPVFTAELKNPLTGQRVEDAIAQYRRDRDPREPLFAAGRCLAHFAADPNLAYVTTRLAGAKTRFLPFNQGRFDGAGNPQPPPSQGGYATAYLWERIWAQDSVLDLVRQFIHEEAGTGGKGRRAAGRPLIFPRYQQLDAVRKLVSHARNHGAGQRYLIQHSAGSGKSYTIAWLAHQLSVLHDAQDRRVFDSIVVVTDRRVLDRQLQHTVRQFEQVRGVVENIDTTSRQLQDALEDGRKIIVTTLQKFPVISEKIGELRGSRFAVIVDEAHSSQSGESSKSLKGVLSAGSLEQAEREEREVQTPEEEVEEAVLEAMQRRGRQPNLSIFAFTATPKSKTLELFGVKNADGTFSPFHLYSMKQAIEERFILDVLENYTTYTSYWKLFRTIEDDPHYEKQKAVYLAKSFVSLHPHAIGEKVRIIVEHFANRVQDKMDGQAKAMIITRSRLHAVRYKLALDGYIWERNYSWKTLVAFSGRVSDGGRHYTESGMNSAENGRTIAERQTAAEFAKPEFRFLVAANKFQTGFDEPLLQAMYVDKKLGGVNAVQSLSRLNRTAPGKGGVLVLDFANEAEEIREAFQPYYTATLLSEQTNPNLLYEKQQRLEDFHIHTEADVEDFAQLFFGRGTEQAQLYAALNPVVEIVKELPENEGREFRSQLTDYMRLYAFLSQVLPFRDASLEKLYQFARHLRPLLAFDHEELPREVQRNIDMESHRIQQTGSGKIALEPMGGRLKPIGSRDPQGGAEEMELLSRIIAELNERFGIQLGPEHRVTLGQMLEKLEGDEALEASARVNSRENMRLAFEKKVEQVIQEIVDTNFDFYRRITDDSDFGETVKNLLFMAYLEKRGDLRRRRS